MKSDAPLMTLGWSMNSGVELTKPTSFTARTTRSRSPPQAFFTCARIEMAQVLAASAPAVTSMSAPRRPLIRPPAFWLIWPETCTRSPTTTKGT